MANTNIIKPKLFVPPGRLSEARQDPKYIKDGYSWYATHVEPRLYYHTKAEAEERAEQYNNRVKAYWKGKYKEDLTKEIPRVISRDDISNTDIVSELKWPAHGYDTWFYNVQMWDDFDVEELLNGADKPDIDETFTIHQNSTRKFFEIFFTVKLLSDHLAIYKRNGKNLIGIRVKDKKK